MTYKPDHTYFGTFVVDERDGHGVSRMGNLWVQGTWVRGKLEGGTKTTLPDGRVFEGPASKDGQPFYGLEGWGKCTYPNGQKYAGFWDDGKFHGSGALDFGNGNLYVGSFKKHKMEGFGTMTYGDKSKYIGQWRRNKKHGCGKLIIFGKGTLQGDWEKDQLVGAGFFTEPDKKVYAGKAVKKEDGVVVFQYEK